MNESSGQVRTAHAGRKTLLATAASWVSPIVTMTLLTGIGWYGHETHWTLGLGERHGPASDANHGNPAAHPPTGAVQFASPDVLDRTGIEVVPVEQRSMVSEILCNGFVDYDERRVAQLSTRVPGTIWRVEKHIGDEVHSGEVLLIIESQQVGTLKADFLNAIVVYESRREQLAILEELQDAVLGRQIREARAALREARNRLTSAEQSLVNLGFDITIREYEPLDDETRLARIRTLGLPAELVAQLDPARITSNLLPLYAPFTGVVVGREAVVGEFFEPGKPIFEVADVSRMLLVLEVSKEHAALVAVGQPVRFRPDGADEEFTSTISWISTEVNEATRTLRVRAEIANRLEPAGGQPDHPAVSLRANTFGTGRIQIARRGQAVVVPVSSVQFDGSRWVVFVPHGPGTFVARQVRPGLRDGQMVELLGETIEPAFSRVVGNGSHVLKSHVLLGRMEAGEM